jgi:DNA polymerase-3 subunit gamma/tau
MGKALYRKYRSKSLSEIVGQDHITSTLEKSIKSGKISHAYLFTGPRGTGKTSVARIFARLINDFPYEIEDEYLDIIEIDAASNTGVDNIRDLREKAIIAPSYGKYKIYIIDEVHMLSKSAFNALLKTLEEPPAHVIFIMATTDAHKVPVTITSRSQQFHFRLANLDAMVNHLRTIAGEEEIKITDDALTIIAKRGGGSFRDSISLLDQISTITDDEVTTDTINSAFGLPSDQLIADILQSYTVKDNEKTIRYLKQLEEFGLKPEIVAEELLRTIINNPEPAYLPLLQHLSDIPRSTHPQAKLLITLMSPATFNTSQHPNSKHSASLNSSETITDNLPVNKPEEPSENVRFKEQNRGTEDSPVPITEHAEKTTGSSEVNFDWQTLLDSIRQESVPLYSHLIKLPHTQSGDKLTIYTRTKLIVTILEKPQNKSLLHQYISPLTYELVPSSAPLVNSPLSAINDIMGGEVQEVELSGDVI